MLYDFPVTNKFEARAVTEPNYQPDLFDKKNLYVNLDDIRGEGYIQDLLFQLNINPQDYDLISPSSGYVKVLFSGHRGCGKTAELRRMHKKLNKPSAYASVFIDLEEDADFARFEAEDFYLLLVLKLVKKMDEEGIKVNLSSLKTLMDKLVNNEEVKKELITSFKTEGSAEVGAGFDLLGFLKVKTNFKNVFSGDNKSSKFIRQEIKRNLNNWITQFNTLLADIRQAFIEANKGKDLLFIVDGSEKLKEGIYKEIFLTNGYLINDISANMIISVPINSYYSIIDSQNSFHAHTVIPMIPLNKDGAITCFKEVINKRIDPDIFIHDQALDYCIQKSGGCIRQLFIIINKAIVMGAGAKITFKTAKQAIKKQGERMSETLTNQHFEVIKGDSYNPGEPLVREMLYGLVLLKYNGPSSIKVNPLLDGLV